MSNSLAHKLLNKSLRKARVRAKVIGTAERPRLSVTISNLHVSAQIIDDAKGHTLASATTVGAKATGTMTEKCALVQITNGDAEAWSLCGADHFCADACFAQRFVQ
jgi:large subunit ribosomal protein L18